MNNNCRTLSRLVDSEHTAVIQDGRPVSGSTIAGLADSLAERLRATDTGRIAVSTHRADLIMAVLCACETAKRQVLLLRESIPQEESTWGKWDVGCLLDESLQEKILDSRGMAPSKAGVLFMTSGTTGTPKIVLHDLDRLLGRIHPSPAEDDTERWLLTYHPASFAGMQVLLTCLISNNLLVAAEHQSTGVLIESALKHRPTHISGTPTFWRSLLVALGSRADQLPLQQITLGGEAVDQNTLDRLKVSYPQARISHIYASTEVGALFAVKDGRAGFPVQWLKDGIEGVRLRIDDGVLEVLSPRAMCSYIASESQHGPSRDGWIVTGDLVEIVGDRVLFRGRLDDMINVGGAKVMPEQVESALLKMPCVRETRVYGIRNSLTGELVAADIVLADMKQEETARREIVQELSASLESHKVPRIMNFVDSIPTNLMGKKIRNQ